MPKRTEFDRSACPVAVTLDIIGDKWTLIVIRDLLRGEKRFNDFLKSPERMRTNILAERLKRLEQHGLIRKSAYQEHPVRYEYHLTRKGAALAPTIQQMCRWANEFFSGTIVPSGKFISFKVEDIKH